MSSGRPTDYRPEYCEMLLKHMASGLSYEVFGATIGVCRATLYYWEKSHPEFLDTKKRAVELSQLFWEKLGLNSLIEERQMNSAIYIFTMKNRFKWTDRIEVAPADAEPREFAQLTEEQLKKLSE